MLSQVPKFHSLSKATKHVVSKRFYAIKPTIEKPTDFSRKRMEVRTEGERILCTEEFGKKIYSMLRSQQFIPPEKLDKEKVKAMMIAKAQREGFLTQEALNAINVDKYVEEFEGIKIDEPQMKKIYGENYKQEISEWMKYQNVLLPEYIESIMQLNTEGYKLIVEKRVDDIFNWSIQMYEKIKNENIRTL